MPKKAGMEKWKKKRRQDYLELKRISLLYLLRRPTDRTVIF